jgi:hypothetical protein
MFLFAITSAWAGAKEIEIFIRYNSTGGRELDVLEKFIDTGDKYIYEGAYMDKGGSKNRKKAIFFTRSGGNNCVTSSQFVENVGRVSTKNCVIMRQTGVGQYNVSVSTTEAFPSGFLNIDKNNFDLSVNRNSCSATLNSAVIGQGSVLQSSLVSVVSSQCDITNAS